MQTGLEFDAMKIARMDDSTLMREYLQTNKDVLCTIFGHNARVYGNQVVTELTRRGITEIPSDFPDWFRPIQIRSFQLR